MFVPDAREGDDCCGLGIEISGIANRGSGVVKVGDRWSTWLTRSARSARSGRKGVKIVDLARAGHSGWLRPQDLRERIDTDH